MISKTKVWHRQVRSYLYLLVKQISIDMASSSMTKGAKTYIGERESLFNKYFFGKLDSPMPKNETGLLSQTIKKKKIQNGLELKLKPETTKLEANRQ